MIMTSRAVDGDGTCGCHHLSDHVIKVVRARQSLEHRTGSFGLPNKIPRTGGQKSGGHNSIGIIGPQYVARNLIFQELIVGQIGIERLDHPVAISPGIVATLIAFKAVSVCIVSNVQPVPSPTFAIMIRGQHFVDKFFISLRILIFDKLLNPFRRRRQTQQVE